MAMMAVLAAVLLTYGVSTGIAREARESDALAGENGELPLDMAKDSVDDMYDKCEDKMWKNVSAYLRNETNKNPLFKEVWGSHYKKGKRDEQKKYQIAAIRTYTDKRGVYRDFNNAVRTQGPEYETKFGYHALHFLLTTKARAKKENQCLTGYRRVNATFSQGVENKEIRFGSFTSASLDTYANETQFGKKSCFEIFTCMGVDISDFSEYLNEREVLIPPYEVFKVIEIKNSSMHPDLPCDVVYKVNSTKTPLSKLNCSLVK
ncbi:GPI-linked NAD(P)(+)--arginine ADP-ribosyltransferase 1-like [Rhinichthys klamathensis goyatoka]|uniref:GPI-linked NAD(P)(+)--arginine ADP-ribosyltransferase 1-like n=1 Tax=Rhinichthys klamathensis goyatoka TaxID=3034132 RepID=UPI0024B4F35F|nr:GPI-linked NAD(P)(+)--arginine ADP-ribosyltransferase 1-like [Rhinichthys klamathensis goyatoka]